MQAMVYVRTETGRALELLEDVKEVEGVKFAVVTPGRFDLVARVEGDDIESLGDKVVSDIHDLEGVKYTETAPIVA